MSTLVENVSPTPESVPTYDDAEKLTVEGSSAGAFENTPEICALLKT